jgi:hypothetical protein
MVVVLFFPATILKDKTVCLISYLNIGQIAQGLEIKLNRLDFIRLLYVQNIVLVSTIYKCLCNAFDLSACYFKTTITA